MFSYSIRKAEPEAFFWRVVDFDGEVVGQGLASHQTEARANAERLIATFQRPPVIPAMSVESRV